MRSVIKSLYCIMFLIPANVDVNRLNQQGNSALLVASENNEAKVCQALLDGRADVNFQYKYNQTPLIVATANEHTDVIRVLLKVILQ